MKKVILLLAIITMVSCEPEKKVDYALISGKIENTSAKKLAIHSQLNWGNKKEITLSEDGSFSDTLDLATDFYVLKENNNIVPLYLPKGSEITITYDAKKKDSTIQLAGNANTVNNYILEKGKLSSKLMGDQKDFFSKNEADFKEHALKIKLGEEELLNKTDGIPEDFKASELKSIKYNHLSFLKSYKPAHSYYIKDRNFKPSEGFLSGLDTLELENESDFLFSQSYRALVASKLKEKSKEFIEKDSTIARDIAYLKTIANLKNQKIKNNLLYADAQYGINYTENLEDYYAIFSKNSTDEANNAKIDAEYKKIKYLVKGNPSPKFTDYENNAGGTKSLDDLKGKYVFIDVWATWCGPCIAQIPSLKKLEKEFHDKNIEFVSISIDTKKDYDKWKKMIVDRELSGLQLIADNDWESKFIQDYGIKGIPRFILIDPQGIIVNADAPRPSDKKLVEILNELNL
ncbi:TlpA family protein disulfide reductase [Polaribacter cellanae]|uniref:TlpA family protein disulfide reductase n=1 Tax=Polaribacter cellanae TaxID=2818493 RepID=A0A975H6J3_9FLAO|nr:TlpA disulfide reductase family protein [Polaribacter cellanae]QTE21974.1 TlpA family protein disulfide reductase [Polaribacter cellanae]